MIIDDFMICKIKNNGQCSKISNGNDNEKYDMIIIIVKLEKDSGNIITTTYYQLRNYWPRKHNPKMDFDYTDPNHNNDK